MRERRVLAEVAAVAVALAAALVPATQGGAVPRAPDPAGLLARALHQPFGAAALPAGARLLGPLRAAAPLTVSVYLQPRDAASLTSFADAANDPTSPAFHDYLTPSSFAERFGPSAAATAVVERFAASNGMTVAARSANGLEVELAGTVGSAERAFGVPLDAVRLRGGGLGRIAIGSFHLPRSVGASIAAVVGLDQVAVEQDNLVRPGRRGAHQIVRPVQDDADLPPGAASPCAAAQEETELGNGGITDDEIASAYGADPLYASGDFGQDTTVALYELEPFSWSDLGTFERCYFGEPHLDRVKVMAVDGGAGIGSGGGEAALDVENVTALAPGAHVLVYEAPNDAMGALDAFNRIVSDDAARVVSTSWGMCESDALASSPGALAVEELLFEEAAAQGQSVFAASGDAGNDACAYHLSYAVAPVPSVEDPASQPYVLGVGGTTAVTTTDPPHETAWDDGNYGGASGGGISALWSQPAWIPSTDDALSSAAPCGAPSGEVCRTVPDVSAFADENEGVTVYVGGTWYTFGGTSSAAPTWAAMLAEVDSSSTCQSNAATRSGIGFAAPLLYEVAANPAAYASGFTDVTTGDNDLFGVDGGSYAARPGDDLVTGLGSPELTAPPGATGPGLAASLCEDAAGGGAPSVTSLAPDVGSAAGGTRVVVTGSGFETDGVPDVAQVNFGSSPAARFTVVSQDRIVAVTGPAGSTTTDRTLLSLTQHAGAALVVVSTTAGATGVGPSFDFTSGSRDAAVPEVLAVGPSGGPGRGGTLVHLGGTGFLGARAVYFGTQRATWFRVLSGTALIARAPRWTRSECLAVSAKTSEDLCQVSVRVTNRAGTSATVPIRPPYAGTLRFDRLGLLLVPARCGCEGEPARTEFDYVTGLALRRVAVAPGGSPITGYPGGGDELQLSGVGFNVLTLNWVLLGPPGLVGSRDYDVVSVAPSGRSLVAWTTPDPVPSTSPETEPLAIDTIGGRSDPHHFRFLPEQAIDALNTEVLSAAGGGTLVLHGGGFRGIREVLFQSPIDQYAPPEQTAGFHVRDGDELTLRAPRLAPATYVVWVCTTWTCSTGPLSRSTLSYLQVTEPGATAVTGATVVGGRRSASGNVAGGTTFELQGAHFGPLGSLQVTLVQATGTGVMTVASGSVTAGPAPTDPGATQTLLVQTPPSPQGTAGLFYVEVSGANGVSALTPAAAFTYTL